MTSDSSLYRRMLAAGRRRWGRMTGWFMARASVLLAGGCILVGVLILGSIITVQFTSRSKFCLTCHYMEPYYESWQASSHKDVPCIDCHYPPGLQMELRRKFQASVQLVKYVTKQYGTRPWTEVDDASCLRSGCHAKRLLVGKVDFNGVDFDHGPHLTQFRRVTRLRCTSCHSQIVQGTHMAATAATCYLCHFKRIPTEQAMAECTTCHKPPLPETTPEAAAAHKLVEERGVRCKECHAGVVEGVGEVPRSRCLTCHSDQERLDQYDDVEAMHHNHVTEHKVDCMRCHQEILHRLPKKDPHGSLDCQGCHPDHHSKVRELYAGAGDHGIEPSPDPMFASRVTCVSCHRTHGNTHGGPVLRAGAAGCMNCHGEEYGRTLAQWQQETNGRLAQLEPVLAKAQRLAASSALSAEKQSQADELCASAESRVLLVKHGKGVHNVAYAKEALNAAADDIDQLFELLGSRDRTPRVAQWGEASPCLDCHAGAPIAPREIYGVTFKHGKHVEAVKGKCTKCHATSDVDAPDHGKIKLSTSQCRACHQGSIGSSHPSNWRSRHGASAQSDRASCRVCHTDDACQSCHAGVPVPHPGDWQAVHGEQAKSSGASACATCHTSEHCSNCHKTPMPHADDWLIKGHGPSFRDEPSSCRTCHEADHCKICHGGLEMPHARDWLDAHGAAAEESPSACGACHEPSVCLKCHRRAPLTSHDDKWPEAHTKTTDAEADFCALCHEEDSCAKCHGVELPHVDNFMMQHKEQASFEEDSVCYKCHDKKEMCALCHQFDD